MAHIAAGVASIPSSPGSVTLSPGFVPRVVFLLWSSAPADGFTTLSSPHRGNAGLGVIGYADDNSINQAAYGCAYQTGHTGNSALGGAANVGACVDMYRGLGTHEVTGVCTGIDGTTGDVTISFSPASLSGLALYWMAHDDPTAIVRTVHGFAGWDTTFTFGKQAVSHMGVIGEQDNTSDNGLCTLWFGAGFAQKATICESYSPGGSVRFSGLATPGVADVENLNPAGGVSLLGGRVDEIPTSGPRNTNGLELKQQSLDLETTGVALASAFGQAFCDDFVVSDADNDFNVGILGTFAIMFAPGRAFGSTWTTSLGISVPKLGFDVAVGTSWDATTGACKVFRYPDRSWVSGWDHSTSADLHAGTVDFEGRHMHFLRTDNGSSNVGKQMIAWVRGIPLQGFIPQIARYI